jgi:hypothetical protein
MADQRRYRSLTELPEFTAQFDDIIVKHSEDVIGPVLRGLLSGISENPHAYNRTTWNMRVAKSASLGLTIPTFRIFFQIPNEGTENESVLLCLIEETSTLDEIL